MNVVYYFSGSGNTKEVATHIAQELDFPLEEIFKNTPDRTETAVVVFPVYCQNIPKPVKRFLESLESNKIALVATYGRISHGNVLKECEKIVKAKIVAAAYVPYKHSYLDVNDCYDEVSLKPLINKIKQSNAVDCVKIPRAKNNVFANFMPSLRSRIGVKIIKTDSCTDCGKCGEICPVNAIKNGIANENCIRCLKCVTYCPNNALSFKLSRILSDYLKRHYDPNAKIEIFV